MKKTVRIFGLFILLASVNSVGQLVHGQSKELKKIRLNVFRIDAATATARAEGFFAAEGIEVDIDAEFNGPDERLKPG